MATLTYHTKKSGTITGITKWDSKTFVPGITWVAVKNKTQTGDHWLRDYILVTQTHNVSQGIQGSVKLNSKGTQVEVANDKYFVICKLVVKRPEKKGAAASKPKKADFFKKKDPSKKKGGKK